MKIPSLKGALIGMLLCIASTPASAYFQERPNYDYSRAVFVEDTPTSVLFYPYGCYLRSTCSGSQPHEVHLDQVPYLDWDAVSVIRRDESDPNTDRFVQVDKHEWFYKNRRYHDRFPKQGLWDHQKRVWVRSIFELSPK